MTTASILIFCAVPLLHAGEPSSPRAGGPTFLQMPVVVAWNRGSVDGPARDDLSSFLCENEDEDDTFDEVPLASGHGRDSAAPAIDADGPCAGRHPVRISPRSASPPLRLRC